MAFGLTTLAANFTQANVCKCLNQRTTWDQCFRGYTDSLELSKEVTRIVLHAERRQVDWKDREGISSQVGQQLMIQQLIMKEEAEASQEGKMSLRDPLSMKDSTQRISSIVYAIFAA